MPPAGPQTAEPPSPQTAPDSTAAGAQPPPGALASSLGITAGALGVPNMIGDFFGGGSSVSILSNTIPVSISADGFIVQGLPGDAGASLVFETGGDTGPDDFFSVGTGTDTTGDGNADSFAISEPVPPSNAPTSPGPGFTFRGGTAVNPTGTFQNGDTWRVSYAYAEQMVVVLPNPSTGGVVVGRMKIAENTSPIPRNRIFLNYSYFDNVPLSRGGVAINRFSPGFETTMFNEQMSFELRTPFAATLDNNLLADGLGDLHSTEFGNVFAAWKMLLARTESTALSVGISFALPTADDIRVGLSNGTPLVDVENRSVHVMPFVGWLMTTPSRYFTQGFLQIDADANGNSVDVNLNGRGLERLGTVQDPTLLYLDLGFGRIYDTNARRITYLAPTVELHYNRSLQSTDVLVAEGFRIGEAKQDIQVLNAVAAVTVGLGRWSTMSLGYSTPIGNGADQMFDGEMRVLWNRNY
jgi:hypothetical protein